MEKVIDKLLKGEQVILSRWKNHNLPKEEKEVIYKSVRAQIVEGEVHDVIDIYLFHEVEALDDNGKIIPRETEIYEVDTMYRIPYTKNKRLLEQMLKLGKKRSFSDFVNRLNTI